MLPSQCLKAYIVHIVHFDKREQNLPLTVIQQCFAQSASHPCTRNTHFLVHRPKSRRSYSRNGSRDGNHYGIDRKDSRRQKILGVKVPTQTFFQSEHPKICDHPIWKQVAQRRLLMPSVITENLVVQGVGRNALYCGVVYQINQEAQCNSQKQYNDQDHRSFNNDYTGHGGSRP